MDPEPNRRPRASDGRESRPLLVLLNGIPASGKSTLARAWCDEHGAELPLALDIDLLRAMIGGWRSAKVPAGHAARRMATAATAAHLRSGRDVLVPQYLQRAGFIDELAETARLSDATFLECALTTDHATAMQRFEARAADAAQRALADDQGELDEPMHVIGEGFNRFLLTRPGIVKLETGTVSLLEQLDCAITTTRECQPFEQDPYS